MRRRGVPVMRFVKLAARPGYSRPSLFRHASMASHGWMGEGVRMEQLKVIGTEDENIVLATESGERFSLAIDDLLGARVEDIQRFEGPVLAEREHIVGQALAVPVLLGADLDGDTHPTFGTAVRGKLAEAGASGERWTSWKEATGWIVKLEFTAAEIDHDARWGFEPRRSTLSPLNPDAIQLSRQGSLPEGLIPRLRALEVNPLKDDSRFDSGAFGPRRLPEPEADLESPDFPPPTSQAVQQAAIKRADEPSATSPETADLLEALRRRRGQREPLPGTDEITRSSSPVALFDALEPGYEESPPPSPEDAYEPDRPVAAEASGRRKGRTSMPSWDEIVFGA